MRLRRLGLPCWDGTRVHAVAPPSYDTSNDELRQVVGSALQESADGHDNGSKEDCLLTPKRVADEDGEDSAKEASQVVSSDCNTLVCRTLLC